MLALCLNRASEFLSHDRSLQHSLGNIGEFAWNMTKFFHTSILTLLIHHHVRIYFGIKDVTNLCEIHTRGHNCTILVI
jgi:hypothetical protein